MANETVKLTKTAWINGVAVPAGTVVSIAHDALEQAYADFERQKVRAAIAAAAGDPDTLLGTSIDLGHLLLVELGKFLQAVSKASSLEAIKEAAFPVADLLSKAAAADYPYQMDGADVVLDEVIERAEKTVAAFQGQPVKDPAVPSSPVGEVVMDPPGSGSGYVSPTLSIMVPNRAAETTIVPAPAATAAACGRWQSAREPGPRGRGVIQRTGNPFTVQPSAGTPP